MAGLLEARTARAGGQGAARVSSALAGSALTPPARQRTAHPAPWPEELHSPSCCLLLPCALNKDLTAHFPLPPASLGQAG